MPSDLVEPYLAPIAPLSFIQVFQSIPRIIEALYESDHTFQRRPGRLVWVQKLAATAILTLYCHLATSGYGLLVDGQIIGWLYLRGWRQIVYIEMLVTAPGWRRRGFGTTLLRFAEAQARQLKREWLGLNVELKNTDALHLYEAQGFRRGHWRIFKRIGSPDARQSEGTAFRLHPLNPIAAHRAFRQFAAGDLADSEPDIGAAEACLLASEPYRLARGLHWLITVEGQPAAYLHRHGSPAQPVIYLAARRSWWEHPALYDAVLQVSHGFPPQAVLTVRTASGGHHNAAIAPLQRSGFDEGPAVKALMFKQVGLGRQA